MLDNILMYVIPILSFFGSIVAIYFTVRKQSSETENIDADTISKLYDAIDKQETRYKNAMAEQELRYQKLKTEFESYKNVMNQQMAYLQLEATKWRSWAEKLNRQLRENNIEPAEF